MEIDSIITKCHKMYSIAKSVAYEQCKKAKFALPSSIKWLPWQPDFTFLHNFIILPEEYIDESFIILISFKTK